MGRGKRRRTQGSVLLSRVGATDEEIGARLGCNRVQVTQWRTGARVPATPNRARLRDLFAIPVDAWDQAPAPREAPKSTPAASSEPAEIDELGTDDVSVKGLAERLRRQAVRDLRLLEADREATLYERSKVSAKIAAVLSTLGKITGEAQEIGESRILRLPAWRRIADRVVAALQPHPKALDAFIAAVESLGGGR